MRRLRLPQEGATSRAIAHSVNQLLIGRINSVGEVTLTPNVTSTEVKRPYVGEGSVVILTPKTANAAAALSTTYVSTSRGAFTITHDNSPQADRTFNFAALGG